jgi:hypothetical protein
MVFSLPLWLTSHYAHLHEICNIGYSIKVFSWGMSMGEHKVRPYGNGAW